MCIYTKIGKVSKERNKEKEKMNQTKFFMEMWSIQAPIKLKNIFLFSSNKSSFIKHQSVEKEKKIPSNFS